MAGGQTTIHTITLLENATINSGDVTGGSTSDDANLTDTDTMQGTEGPGGVMSANLTETHTAQGTGSFIFNQIWSHPGIANGFQAFALTSSRNYHDAGYYLGGPNPVKVPTDAGGTDSAAMLWHIFTSTSGGDVDIVYNTSNTVTYQPPGYQPPGNPAPPPVPAGQIGESWNPVSTWAETAYGQVYDPTTYVAPQFDGRDWLAKASDFAAGMGDAVSCGLTQKIRSGLGYDDAVDKSGNAYMAGQVTGTVVALAAGGANPCGAAKGIALAVKSLSAVQGTGQLLNAADAAKNGDPLGFALNVIGARMSFSKLGQACFAAGTPLYDTWTTAKPIEEFRPGDMVLSRDENDPAGLPVLKAVEEVFVGTARVMHVHAGGQVIRTTAVHPFWVEGKGWLEAERLQPGDRLGSHDGQSVTVREVYDTGETEAVYNLRIADYHTYFVGCPEWGWSAWAHNACNNPFGSRGGPAHLGKIGQAEQRLASKGWTTVKKKRCQEPF